MAHLQRDQCSEPGGQLSTLVLIRETRAGETEVVRPALSVDQLLGTWRGEAITYRTDWSVSKPMATELTVSQSSSNTILQTWCAGPAKGSSHAKIAGSRLIFEQTGYQLLFLPNGGSSLCPQAIQRQTAFRCEIGWLIEPNTRLRLTREYRNDGSWAQQTLIKEKKVI